MFFFKGKGIPMQAWVGPEGSGGSGSQDFQTLGTRRLRGCQPYAPAAFIPEEILGTLFCYRLGEPQRY
jgi:hypothetical protein